MERSSTDIAALRESFAKLVTASSHIPAESAITAAFAATPREDFVGPPPWKVFAGSDYVETPADDPALLYKDVVVALKEKASINNGQPSLHAQCLSALAVKRGDTVVHVGAGTGYYTALLARLVGETGSVDAYEIEPDLAQRAATNLAGMPQVRVHAGSGTVGPLPECDVLYVNAGATSPLDVWLDALRPKGRLLFPLTPDDGVGAMLLVTRTDQGTYSARSLCHVMFIPCVGGRDAESERRLSKAFRQGKIEHVRSLHRDNSPDDTAWASGDGWWLSTRA